MKLTVLLKKLLNSDLTNFFFGASKFFLFPHCVYDAISFSQFLAAEIFRNWWVRYLLFGEIGTPSSAEAIKLSIVNIRSNLQYFAIILQKCAKTCIRRLYQTIFARYERWKDSRVVITFGCHPRDP